VASLSSRSRARLLLRFRLLRSFSALAFFFHSPGDPRPLPSFPTRRSSDLVPAAFATRLFHGRFHVFICSFSNLQFSHEHGLCNRSEEHTSELQSLAYLVCRLLLEKKKYQETQD